MPKNQSEFLNPKSMLTPGIAGSTVMVLTQALANSFQLPLAITAIVLSFLVGLLVFTAKAIPLWQRIVFYALNSLIIFSIAVGTSAAASGHSPPPQVVAPAQVDLTRAKKQLTQLEASERKLKESIAKLTEEHANTNLAAADLAKLQAEVAKVRSAVEASVQNTEHTRAPINPGSWFRKIL